MLSRGSVFKSNKDKLLSGEQIVEESQKRAREQPKIIICDECKHEFNAASVGFESSTEIIKGVGQIMVQYFRCPKCGRLYLVMVETKATREKHVRYMKMLEEYRIMLLAVKREKIKKGKATQKLLEKKWSKIQSLGKELKKAYVHDKRTYQQTLSQMIESKSAH